MRSISPSEATDFQWCQKMWYNKRHLRMIPIAFGYKDLAMFMGRTVGVLFEKWYNTHYITKKPGNLDKVNIEEIINESFFRDIQRQLDLGRRYEYGVADRMERISDLIHTLFTTLMGDRDRWIGDGKIIAVEPVMEDWGNARQDIILEQPNGDGIVMDIKCKMNADSTKFPISRDIDLAGNQSELYPLAWNSLDHKVKIKQVMFVYLLEGKIPIIERRSINYIRQENWLQGYNNTTVQINALEQHPENIWEKVIENPYHITPWGYPCEWRYYCTEGGESPSGASSEFIQIEGRQK